MQYLPVDICTFTGVPAVLGLLLLFDSFCRIRRLNFPLTVFIFKNSLSDIDFAINMIWIDLSSLNLVLFDIYQIKIVFQLRQLGLHIVPVIIHFPSEDDAESMVYKQILRKWIVGHIQGEYSCRLPIASGSFIKENLRVRFGGPDTVSLVR